MRYQPQSDVWRLDHATKYRKNGTNGQSRILAHFHQVFPLSLFRDELIIEERRIVWIHKSGPWSHRVISIMATDIACVHAASGPFFGQVNIKSLTGGPEIYLHNLLRRNVFKIRNLVEGIALASREGLPAENISLSAQKASLFRAGNISLT